MAQKNYETERSRDGKDKAYFYINRGKFGEEHLPLLVEESFEHIGGRVTHTFVFSLRLLRQSNGGE